MQPFDPSSASQTATELDFARELLAIAAAEIEELRARARALAATTDWQSRAVAGFRSKMAELIERLDRLAREIDHADADLARDRSRALAVHGSRW